MADFESWLANNKALWARVYDEIIVPDLEKEWKKRLENHETEWKRKDEHLQILTNHVSNGVVESAKLKEENTRLKIWLQKLNHGTTPSPEELISYSDEATIPIKDYSQVTEKLEESNKRYEDATQRIKYLERKNVAVMQKNKDMKESVKAWQEYCDRHIDKKKMKTEAKSTKAQPSSAPAIDAPAVSSAVPSSSAPPVMRRPQSLVAQERSSPAPMTELSHTFLRPHTADTTSTGDVVDGNAQREADANPRHEEHQEPMERVENGGHSSPLLPVESGRGETTSSINNDRATFLGHPSSDKLGSSQTTVPEVVEQDHETVIHVANRSDVDDEPEFVSERSLKRKRKPSTAFRIYHDGSSDGTPAKPVRVKEELHSSPPPESAINQLLRKETMDLDELGPNVIMTPRRQRLQRVNSIHSNETGTLRNQRSSSAPFGGNLNKPESTEEVHIATPRPSSVLAVEMEDSRALSEPGDVILEPRGVLQPLDPNVVAVRANEGTPNKRTRREEAREETKFNSLAESGEAPPTGGRKKRLPPNLARAHFNERIRAAKSGLSPTKNALATPKSAPAKILAAEVPTPPSSSNRPAYTPSARPAPRKAPATVPRPELVPDGRPVWRMGAAEPARKAPASPTPKEQPPEGPLRNKPVSELRIQDFKPNPRYNQGYTYAFAETVRKRTDRLCLPGCTNPTCCGSTFRTLASAAAPLSSSQEEALLQDYLGDAYDSFGLTQMSQEERDEIILQARTRKMAKEHGKHRRAYEGRKTPPGFWRVDFPTTQEQEEDRERAVQMEQGEVRERWLEAQRPRGRWVFRDE